MKITHAFWAIPVGLEIDGWLPVMSLTPEPTEQERTLVIRFANGSFRRLEVTKANQNASVDTIGDRVAAIYPTKVEFSAPSVEDLIGRVYVKHDSDSLNEFEWEATITLADGEFTVHAKTDVEEGISYLAYQRGYGSKLLTRDFAEYISGHDCLVNPYTTLPSATVIFPRHQLVEVYLEDTLVGSYVVDNSDADPHFTLEPASLFTTKHRPITVGEAVDNMALRAVLLSL